MVNAHDIAKRVTKIGSWHQGPKYDTDTQVLRTMLDYIASEGFRRYVIDHVYTYGAVEVGLVDVPVSETALLTTDHTLVMADFDCK